MGETLLFALADLFAGSLPFSVWAGRLVLKRDMRCFGDRDPGTSSAWRAGRGAAMVSVLAGIVLAGMAPVEDCHAYPTAQRPLNGCDFLTASTGWVVGDRGVILRTVTRGQFWHRQRSPAGRPPALRDVAFADRRNGWAVGAGGLVLATTDGGTTWQHRLQDGALDLRAVVASSSGAVFVVGWSGGGGDTVGIVLRSSDGGRTWSRADTGAGVRLWDVAFADGQNGWAVGARAPASGSPSAEGAVVFATADGGASWSPIADAASMGLGEAVSSGLFAVDAVAASPVVCGGRQGVPGSARGVILASFDGGATWRSTVSRRLSSVRAVSFGNRSRAWAAGLGGGAVMLATRNGGLTWKVRRLPRGARVRAIDLIDGRRGWAVGDAAGHRGLVLRTVDGGAHWTRVR